MNDEQIRDLADEMIWCEHRTARIAAACGLEWPGHHPENILWVVRTILRLDREVQKRLALLSERDRDRVGDIVCDGRTYNPFPLDLDELRLTAAEDLREILSGRDWTKITTGR